MTTPDPLDRLAEASVAPGALNRILPVLADMIAQQHNKYCDAELPGSWPCDCGAGRIATFVRSLAGDSE